MTFINIEQSLQLTDLTHSTPRDAHTQLKQTLERLNDDWSIKSNSLELEERCMTKRQKLLLVAHNV